MSVSPKFPRANFVWEFFSKYRLVGCPEHRSGMLCSSSTVIAHIEPPNSRKRPKRGKKGQFWPKNVLVRTSEGFYFNPYRTTKFEKTTKSKQRKPVLTKKKCPFNCVVCSASSHFILLFYNFSFYFGVLFLLLSSLWKPVWESSAERSSFCSCRESHTLWYTQSLSHTVKWKWKQSEAKARRQGKILLFTFHFS